MAFPFWTAIILVNMTVFEVPKRMSLINTHSRLLMENTALVLLISILSSAAVLGIYRARLQPEIRIETGPKSIPPQYLNLNTASKEQLICVPGIGPVRAQQIIEWRTMHGPYTSLSQLELIKGIGPQTLLKLQNFLRVQP